MLFQVVQSLISLNLGTKEKTTPSNDDSLATIVEGKVEVLLSSHCGVPASHTLPS